MKLASVVLALNIILLSFTITPTVSSIPENAFVAAWSFDGTGGFVKDISGNGHDGEIMGVPERVDDGKFGKAMSFPGELTSYVEVPNHPDLQITDSITLVGWLKSDFPEWQGDLVCKDEGNPLPNRHYNIHATTPVNGQTPGRIYLSGTTVTGTSFINDGEWHHIAGTWDGETGRLYIDGKLETEEPFSGPLSSSDVPVEIGRRGGQRFINGLLDDIAIFNVALTEDQIREIIENGLANAMSISPTGKLAVRWAKIKRDIQ